MSKNETSIITEAEAALYDRQIRLWGLDAQKRLRGTRLLLVGLGGVGAEICKNIVLAGVQSITLLDHRPVTPLDFCSQFLISRTDLDKNRALASVSSTQELNPNVCVTADQDDIANKTEDYFRQFDIVCLTCCTYETLVRVDRICHEVDVKFFAGDTYGFYGFMFTDLNEHKFLEEKICFKKIPANPADGPAPKKPKYNKEATYVKRTINFSRLSDAMKRDWTLLSKRQMRNTPRDWFVLRVLWKFQQEFGRTPSLENLENDRTELLRMRDELFDGLGIQEDLINDEFASHCVAELSPVCAIVGGVLGQEIIKAASCRDIPHNNFFFFNGLESTGMVDCIQDNTKCQDEADKKT